jgi:general secretion pathway protein E
MADSDHSSLVAERQPPAVLLEQALLALGLVPEEVLGQARTLSRENRESLGKVLVDMGVLSEDQLFHAYAQCTTLPLWDGEGEVVIADSELQRDFLAYNRILPVDRGGERWLVFDEALDDGLIDLLRRLAPEATLALYPSGALHYLLDQHLGGDLREAPGGTGGEVLDIEHLRDLALEAPIIRQVNDIIGQAVRMGASDIHLEPFRHRIELRYRVDGVLQNWPAPRLEDYPAIVSRLKLLAGLDIAERRQSQDGRIRTKSSGRDVDIRVSVIPTLCGEDVVLRLLDQERQILSLAQCGISETLLQSFQSCLENTHGILLVTGPTGSGKTTTLYSALRHITDGQRKIITVEDPVEYEIPGIVQIPVNEAVGLGFANALRAILRHDPDVIFIGEIRDRETADIAIQASLTGHLVLATLHTNSAMGAISRLLDMGIPDFLLASSLLAVSAQRLVRRLCPDCKVPKPLDPALAERYRLPLEMPLFEPAGCLRCAHIGYRGRLPLFEFRQVDAPVREVILHHPSLDALEAAAKGSGLLEDGIYKVRLGWTSLEEVLRVVR